MRGFREVRQATKPLTLTLSQGERGKKRPIKINVLLCQNLRQQLLDTLFEVPAVELLGMPAQCRRAKQRLVCLEKAYRFLQSLRGARRKQDPCRRLAEVNARAWRPGAARVIGGNDCLQSPTQAQRNHRAPMRLLCVVSHVAAAAW